MQRAETVQALMMHAPVAVCWCAVYRTRFSSTGQRGDTFLLLGPMGSGKTSLYFQLKQGAFRQTVTSMKENDAIFTPKALADKVSHHATHSVRRRAGQLTMLLDPTFPFAHSHSARC